MYIKPNPPGQPQGPVNSYPPVQSSAVSQTTPITPEAGSKSTPSQVPGGEDHASLNGVPTYAFTEKDISFSPPLQGSNRIHTTPTIQAIGSEGEDPYALGAAQMLSEAGKAAFQAGDFEAATLFYEAAWEYDRKSPVLAYNLGRCYQRCGDQDKAVQMFETAKALDPLNLELKQRIEKANIP